MNRNDTLRRLERIADMSEEELFQNVLFNAGWVQETAAAARLHLVQLRNDRERIKRGMPKKRNNVT